uniref:V-type proton ATPase subunit C n=1 Tax=Iconisemion striatum TaxID=60296 RepID=A0A1A7XRP6_9TELE
MTCAVHPFLLRAFQTCSGSECVPSNWFSKIIKSVKNQKMTCDFPGSHDNKQGSVVLFLFFLPRPQRCHRFTVRDFQYNEEEMKADKEEMTRLSTDKKKQFGPLVRWLKVNFSEAFIAWIHIKALRVFVESVLRYGLPVNFQAMLLQPNKKNMKKLREVLYDLYKHLDSSAAIIDASMDIPGLNLSQQEYYPYVYYKIDCNLLDFKA